jgi:hypothetical protein
LALVIGVHLALAGIVLAPFFSVAIPGLGDTLNHLARMHILATIDRSPALQRFYEVRWAPIPYLAMDAIVPLLMRVVPIYVAGKLFVAACIVLPVAGTAALHAVVHRRASLVPCAAWLVATNALLSLGFLNFLFSAGCALLLFAAWVATTAWPRWPRAALSAPLVLLLYFGHVFACAAYCLAVAGRETGRALRARFRPRLHVLADLAAAFAQAIPALCCAATLDVASGYLGPLHTRYGSLAEKLAAAASPMLFLHDAVHGVALLCAALLAALLAPRLRLDRGVWPAGLAVALASAAVPHVLASTWGTDLRLPLLAVLLGLAAASFRMGPGGRVVALAGLIALVGVKSADAWVVLHAQDAQFAAMRAVLADLPRGARLLVVTLDGHGTGREAVPISTRWHMPMVAVIEHDAFLPTLFTGLSTVHVRSAFLASSTPNGLPISPDQLRDGQAADGAAIDRGDGQGARLYHFGWPAKFDFVLLERFGGDTGTLPARLSLVRRVGPFELYRILPR